MSFLVREAVLVFVKNPKPGTVKTRLSAELGPQEATRIYRVLAETVIKSLPADAGRLILFDPPAAEREIRSWLAPLARTEDRFIPQSAGDLGRRLAAAFAHAFSDGFSRVVVVGSDCVELGQDTFDAAFSSLEDHDCVVGPARDGGYYLMGLRAPMPQLFKEVPWSSPNTFAITVERARACGARVALLPMLGDVDTADDWLVAKNILQARNIDVAP